MKMSPLSKRKKATFLLIKLPVFVCLPEIASLCISAGRKPTCSLPFRLASAACQQPIQSCLFPSIRWGRLNFKLQQTDPSAPAWGSHNLTSLLLDLPWCTACNDPFMSHSYLFAANVGKKRNQQKRTHKGEGKCSLRVATPLVKKTPWAFASYFAFCLANAWRLAREKKTKNASPSKSGAHTASGLKTMM